MLRAAGQGDSVARDKLATRVYDDLKRTAQHMMRWEPGQTLQPTALVNEAYMRLFEHSDFANSPNRAYFFAAAGQARHDETIPTQGRLVAAVFGRFRRGNSLQSRCWTLHLLVFDRGAALTPPSRLHIATPWRLPT